MRGALQFWPIALLAGVAGAIWLVVLVWSPPFLVRGVAATAIAAIGLAILWFAFGGRVVGYLVWLVPLSIATVAQVLWPSLLTIGVHTAILVLPFLGWAFEPIGRAYSSVTVPVESWLLQHSLSREDQRTREQLLVAIRGNPQMRADSRQLEDLPRAIDAMRRHAEEILAVEAPDLGWKRTIKDAAAPRILYHEMWAGQRPLDYDLVNEEIREANRALRDFLRSRSLGYRILTHRFIEPDNPASD